MNAFLAEIVRYCNALLAVTLIIGGAIIGEGMGVSWLVGLIVGFLLSVFLCGLLAIFISMRNELILIRQILSQEER